MIEPTDEMLWAALDAYDEYCTEQRSEDGFRLALAAVLAVVERDYELVPRQRCMNLGTAFQCERPDGHDGSHQARPGGLEVSWS